MGLVGESGSGKSTLAKILMRLDNPSSGEIFFEEKNIFHLSAQELREFRKSAQMVFQDPYSSLNPRMTMRQIVAEPLLIHRIHQEELVTELLESVGLSSFLHRRFPHELSGGQRQRVGIARALALSPKLLVCDEPISSLDVSNQAQIVSLLQKLQKERALSYLFITHDLAIARYLCTKIAVLYAGHLLELSPAKELYQNPQHPYTQELLASVVLRGKEGKMHTVCTTPQKIGCPFANRCLKATPNCKEITPLLLEKTPGHFVACHNV